jgi:hypothetical protein
MIERGPGKSKPRLQTVVVPTSSREGREWIRRRPRIDGVVATAEEIAFDPHVGEGRLQGVERQRPASVLAGIEPAPDEPNVVPAQRLDAVAWKLARDVVGTVEWC